MNPSILAGGRLDSPYFIFIRCAGAYSDADLLQAFGLSDYKRAESPPEFGPYVLVTNDREWTQLADDWYYTLWHRPSTRQVIAEIAKCHDVFACSVGDCDRSYDFIYYHHGELARMFVVEDPHFCGGSVVQNVGAPLAGEAEAMKHSDELKIVLAIAASLGIGVETDLHKVRVYSKPRAGGMWNRLGRLFDRKHLP